MRKSLYKGLLIESKTGLPDDWQVLIRKTTLHGQLNAIKKSIDWWNETGAIVQPRAFSHLNNSEQKNKSDIYDYKGFQIRNDTSDVSSWYCLYHGRLIKGSLNAIKSVLDKFEK